MKHNITPTTIIKEVRDVIRATKVAEEALDYPKEQLNLSKLTQVELKKVIEKMEQEMKQAARDLNFEKAAELRDLVFELKAEG